MNNSTIVGFIGAVALCAGFVLGFTVFNGGNEPTSHDVGTSATGSTFSTQKMALSVMVPTSASATSTSILNTDANDRIVTDSGVSCTGATAAVFGTGAVATWNWKAGTTSTSAPSAIASTVFLAMNVDVATGTYNGFTATSTFTNPISRVWPTGTYMTFITNATSSSVTECTPFVNYIPQ